MEHGDGVQRNFEPLSDLIRKTIDDTVKNKDRYVSLFVGEYGISMNVYSYEKGLQKWIRVSSNKFRCPECGYIFDHDYPFCPSCGERLGCSNS